MKWSFYSRRKRISLDSFLKDCDSISAALKKFESLGIESPELSQIEIHFQKSQEKEAKAKEKIKDEAPVSKPSVSRATRKNTKKASSPGKSTTDTSSRSESKRVPRSQKKPDSNLEVDILSRLDSEELTEEKDEKKPYFRKIIKPEKK